MYARSINAFPRIYIRITLVHYWCRCVNCDRSKRAQAAMLSVAEQQQQQPPLRVVCNGTFSMAWPRPDRVLRLLYYSVTTYSIHPSPLQLTEWERTFVQVWNFRKNVNWFSDIVLPSKHVRNPDESRCVCVCASAVCYIDTWQKTIDEIYMFRM